MLISNPKITIKLSAGNFIIFVIIVSFFNDIIRIPNTIISLYRILLPIGLILTISWSGKKVGYFIFSVFLLLLLILQNYIFCYIRGVDFTINHIRTVSFVIHYISAISIFLFVRFLRIHYKTKFLNLFLKIIPKISFVFILMFLYRFFSEDNALHVANINNYAICLAVIFPVYFIKTLDFDFKSAVYAALIFILLWIGDAKAALFGVILEILLIIVMKSMKHIIDTRKISIIFLALMFCSAIAIVESPIVVNGYPIKVMFNEMVSHIITGTPYIRTTSSLTYRTNSIIYMFDAFRSSYFIGIGVGNAGVYIAELFSGGIFGANVEPLSPHFGLLEFICDCGIWMLLVYLYSLYKALRLFFNSGKADNTDIFFTSVMLSSPIWSMSASGLYTIYYMFAILACFREWYALVGKKEKRVIYEQIVFGRGD